SAGIGRVGPAVGHVDDNERRTLSEAENPLKDTAFLVEGINRRHHLAQFADQFLLACHGFSPLTSSISEYLPELLPGGQGKRRSGNRWRASLTRPLAGWWNDLRWCEPRPRALVRSNREHR